MNEQLNLINQCIESYGVIPDNVCTRLMEQIEQILATRPTCGKEQRKFLDEVESDKFVWLPYSNGLIANNNHGNNPTNIFQVNFKADLQKVQKGE